MAAKRPRVAPIKITVVFNGFVVPIPDMNIKITSGHIYDGGVQAAHIKTEVKEACRDVLPPGETFEVVLLNPDGTRRYLQNPQCHHTVPVEEFAAMKEVRIVTTRGFWDAWVNAHPGRRRPECTPSHPWTVQIEEDFFNPVWFFTPAEQTEWARLQALLHTTMYGNEVKPLPEMKANVLFIDTAAQTLVMHEVTMADLHALLVAPSTAGSDETPFVRDGRTYRRRFPATQATALPGVQKNVALAARFYTVFF